MLCGLQILTGDPTILDQTLTDKETWFDTVSDLEDCIIHSPFDEFGNLKEREAELHFFDVGEISADDSDPVSTDGEPSDIDDIIDSASGVIFAHELQINSNTTSPSTPTPEIDSSGTSLSIPDDNQPSNPPHCPTSIKYKQRDYEPLHCFFLHQPSNIVERTFEATIQFAQHQHWKSTVEENI